MWIYHKGLRLKLIIHTNLNNIFRSIRVNIDIQDGNNFCLVYYKSGAAGNR